MSDASSPPTSFGVLLFPGFQALDVFGPLDILNVLSYTHPLTLSLISSSLDPVTTLPPRGFDTNNQIFPQPHLISQSIVPTHTFSTAPSDLEVLLVPGGYGTRDALTEEIDFIRKRFPSLRYIMSVCTGSVVLARSGVLDGKKATSNKRAWEWVKELGDGKIEWVQTARWVEDGKCWTTSGITAGMDGMLAFVEKHWGKEVADGLAAGMEMERKSDWRDDVWAGYWEAKREEEKKRKK